MAARSTGLARHLNGVSARYVAKADSLSSQPALRRRLMGLFSLLYRLYRNRISLLYVIDVGPINLLAGTLAKVLLRTRFVIDTGDLIYELAVAEGSPFLVRAIKKVSERLSLTLSDAIVVRGAFHKELLQKRGYRNVFCIPDGVDTSFSYLRDVTELRRDLKLQDVTTVGLMGTTHWNRRTQTCNGWELVEAIALLRDLPVVGLLIGDGSGLRMLKRRAFQLKIGDKVKFFGRLPYDRLPNYLSLIDICLLTQPNNLCGWVRTTGKLPEYLALGRYIIATEVGAVATILGDKRMGKLLPYEGVQDDSYPPKLADTIRCLIHDKGRSKDTKVSVSVAKRRFDYRVLAGQLETALDAVYVFKTCPTGVLENRSAGKKGAG